LQAFFRTESDEEETNKENRKLSSSHDWRLPTTSQLSPFEDDFQLNSSSIRKNLFDIQHNSEDLSPTATNSPRRYDSAMSPSTVSLISVATAQKYSDKKYKKCKPSSDLQKSQPSKRPNQLSSTSSSSSSIDGCISGVALGRCSSSVFWNEKNTVDVDNDDDDTSFYDHYTDSDEFSFELDSRKKTPLAAAADCSLSSASRKKYANILYDIGDLASPEIGDVGEDSVFFSFNHRQSSPNLSPLAVTKTPVKNRNAMETSLILSNFDSDSVINTDSLSMFSKNLQHQHHNRYRSYLD
jgi:hypothetical protein